MKNNTGNRNTGDFNTGNYNTGNYNTGCSNTGYYNTGNYNTGHSNTGFNNTGNCNTGHSNTGNLNAGDLNAGDFNTGNWNTVNKETGFFNTIKSETIRVFNKKCSTESWNNAKKPSFLFFKVAEWVYSKDMSEKEKNDNPSYKTTGGYLKKLDYKEAFQKSFAKASKEDIELLKKLPNFDAEVFKEISGIDLSEKSCNNKVVEIDGKNYKLVELED